MKAEIPNSIGEIPETEVSFKDIVESHSECKTQHLNDMEHCYSNIPPYNKDILAIIKVSNIASL